MGGLRSITRAPNGRLLAGGALLALVANAGDSLAGTGTSTLHTVLGTWVFFGLASAALIACFARIGVHDSEQDVWIPVAVAMTGWLAGSFHYRESGASITSFWPGDLVLAALILPAAFALGRVVRRQVQPFQGTILLDGVIVAFAGAALTAAVLSAGLDRVAVNGQPTTLKLLYPIGAVMLLSFTVWILALTGWRTSRLWSFAVSGLGLFTITSMAFVFAGARNAYTAGGPLDTLWIGAAIAIAIAAWQPSPEPLEVRLEAMHRITAISAAGLIALALLIVGSVVALNAITIVLAAAALIAMILRAAVSFRENVGCSRMRAGGADRLTHRPRQPAQADDRPRSARVERASVGRRAYW